MNARQLRACILPQNVYTEEIRTLKSFMDELLHDMEHSACYSTMHICTFPASVSNSMRAVVVNKLRAMNCMVDWYRTGSNQFTVYWDRDYHEEFEYVV